MLPLWTHCSLREPFELCLYIYNIIVYSYILPREIVWKFSRYQQKGNQTALGGRETADGQSILLHEMFQGDALITHGQLELCVECRV